MAKAEVKLTINTEEIRRLAASVHWFAGRLTAAADELVAALDDIDGGDSPVTTGKEPE